MQRRTDKPTQQGIGRRAVDADPASEPEYAGAERRSGAARRLGVRSRALLTGKIVIDDGRVSYDCVIRNLSTKGARVRIPNSIGLPSEVGLLVVKEGLLFDAAIAWRRGDQIGLTFSGQHDLRESADPAHRGVRALWAALAPL
jgi:hypothetical protein